MAPPFPPSAHLARLLTRTALPLLQPPHSLPFRASTLSLASTSLPAPYTPSEPFSERSIHALYPSPPPASPAAGEFSLKGLLLGNGGRRSRSREELVALALGRGTAGVGGEKEKTGPARALVEEWLREGRREMGERVRASGRRGDEAFRLGVEERLRYNATVPLASLPEALALLAAPRSSYLSNPLELLPVPNPAGHLSHVAAIAQDLAKAGGSEAQGTAWYTLRLRLSLIYTLSELRLLSHFSPSPSPSSPFSPAPSAPAPAAEEALADAIAFSRTLVDQTAALGEKVNDAQAYAEWVGKSWAGLIRSAGV
ncbi:hypothetical protein JCM10213v2_003687 [Rhodosporidiobolus nylandii]